MNKKESIKTAKDLINFIYQSPSSFHAVNTLKERLADHGFTSLIAGENWSLEKGGKYFITINDSAIIAVEIGHGEVEQKGFAIIGAHTDSPCLRVKPNPEMVENGYIKLNAEIYGGPILNTWLDRPLSLAGRVSLKSKSFWKPSSRLVSLSKLKVIIPNVAIHLNKTLNKGYELNRQKDMLPILGLVSDNYPGEGLIKKLLAKELSVKEEEILDFDLFVHHYQKGELLGLEEEFVVTGRLDNLAMAHAGMSAMLASGKSDRTKVLACFDNEEVGSASKQGADSPLLSHVLERVALGLGKERNQILQSIFNSFIISADMAHAVHPNLPEKHDPTNKPAINQGPVIKINANQKYTTDSDSAAVFTRLCQEAKVPCQQYVNRSDEPAGSTIGPLSATQLPIRSLDIGNPMLAMHSINEMCGSKDQAYLIRVFKRFYNG